MEQLNVEVAIIGGGTAGMGAYREVSKFTDSIVLIEGGPFGTTCARVGCMPSKLLIAPAEAHHRLDSFDAFGIEIGAATIDGERIMQRVRSERDRFVGFVTETVDGYKPEHIVRAYARFASPHTLALFPPQPDFGEAPAYDCVRAERIVIAAGSRPRIPAYLREAGDRLLVNDDIFNWTQLPESIAVFGTGVIGLELGQALHRLGVRVRLFGRGGRLGGFSDPVVRDYARQLFEAELPYASDTYHPELRGLGDAVEVCWQDAEGEAFSERFDYVLSATGRESNLDQLALENSGLPLDAFGVPNFDPSSMQAAGSHVFIAGDATADGMLLHEASDEGRLAGENAGRFPDCVRRQRKTPLAVVFSDPQIAFAGQRYAQLKSSGVDFAVGEVSFENQGRSRVMLMNKGMLRVYGERSTQRLLGAEMIGPANEHLAHLLAWAIQMRMSVGEILQMPFYHPVIEEGLRTALRELYVELGEEPQPYLPLIESC